MVSREIVHYRLLDNTPPAYAGPRSSSRAANTAAMVQAACGALLRGSSTMRNVIGRDNQKLNGLRNYARWIDDVRAALDWGLPRLLANAVFRNCPDPPLQHLSGSRCRSLESYRERAQRALEAIPTGLDCRSQKLEMKINVALWGGAIFNTQGRRFPEDSHGLCEGTRNRPSTSAAFKRTRCAPLWGILAREHAMSKATIVRPFSFFCERFGPQVG